jgi:hypothetical protein
MNKKSEGLDREIQKELLTNGCTAIKNYVANLHGRLN